LWLYCITSSTGNANGKVSWIIIVAEGKAKAHAVADAITQKTGLESRVAVLGHIQRGGSPTALDRIMAARLGNAAVDTLVDGQTDCCVTLKDHQVITIPLDVAIQPKDIEVQQYYRLIKILT